VVLWVDVPMLYEPLPEEAAVTAAEVHSKRALQALVRTEEALQAGVECVKILGCLWLVFCAEFLLRFLLRDRQQPFWRTHLPGLVGCLCPPLRLCSRQPDMDGRLWLPVFGWRRANKALRVRLERVFSVPMILIAMAILPILLVEFGMRHQVAQHRWLQHTLHVSLGVIWFAFAAEFVVMLSVADKKLRYCKEHWIDIAIILLPFVSFLRSLRIIRVTRVAQLARMEQLVKMSRLYRLRGLAMRALRAMLLLKLLNRLLPSDPRKQLQRLREQLKDKQAEVRQLKLQIVDLERTIAANEARSQSAGEQGQP
jgi:voltage-gated potassium channel